MKLQEAIILGRFCGLNTVDECITNIDIHYWQCISNKELNRERAEFEKDINNYKIGRLKLDWDYINKKVKEDQEEYEDWYIKNENNPDLTPEPFII